MRKIFCAQSSASTLYTRGMTCECVEICYIYTVSTMPHCCWSPYITRYGSTLYIGIAMVVHILQYIRKCQFLLSVSSKIYFKHFYMTKHVEKMMHTINISKKYHLAMSKVMLKWIFTFSPCSIIIATCMFVLLLLEDV